VEMYYPIKQYSFHTECPVVKSVHKMEVTVHFTREDTLYILWYLTIYVVAFI